MLVLVWCRDDAVLAELEAKKKAGFTHVMTTVPPSVATTIRMTPDQIEECIRRKVEQRTREPAAQYREGVFCAATAALGQLASRPGLTAIALGTEAVVMLGLFLLRMVLRLRLCCGYYFCAWC